MNTGNDPTLSEDGLTADSDAVHQETPSLRSMLLGRSNLWTSEPDFDPGEITQLDIVRQRLLVTCIHFNNSPEVIGFVAQLNELELPAGWSLEIAICDTGGSWPDDLRLPENTFLFHSGVNLGYLNGCAFALARWKALCSMFDEVSTYGHTAHDGSVLDANGTSPYPWVAVMNTDLTLAPDFFLQLLSAPLPENTGLIAPSVCLLDGTAQNPFFVARPGRARMFAYTVIYRSSFLTALLHLMHRIKRGRPRAGAQIAAQDSTGSFESDIAAPAFQPIYAAHGSVMILHPQFFEKGGTLDYPGFLFGEELHIAEQVRNRGLASLWLPGALVVHRAHTSTGCVTSVRRRRWMLQSARVLWRAYWRRPERCEYSSPRG